MDLHNQLLRQKDTIISDMNSQTFKLVINRWKKLIDDIFEAEKIKESLTASTQILSAFKSKNSQSLGSGASDYTLPGMETDIVQHGPVSNEP